MIYDADIQLNSEMNILQNNYLPNDKIIEQITA